MLLSILIPVFNEASSLEEIMRKVDTVDLSPLGFQKEIIIVDDGSTDKTKDFLKTLNGDHAVFFHEKNKGKGSAIRTGLAKAKGDYVIIQDADLEYDPQDYLPLLQCALEKNAAAVYGSRRLKKKNVQYSGLSYYVGGLVVTWLANLLYGIRLTDEPTCYKLFKTDILKKIPLECEGFEFCPEVTAKVAKRGHEIFEVPIHYFPRHENEGKKLKWKDGVVAVWTLIKHRFK